MFGMSVCTRNETSITSIYYLYGTRENMKEMVTSDIRFLSIALLKLILEIFIITYF